MIFFRELYAIYLIFHSTLVYILNIHIRILETRQPPSFSNISLLNIASIFHVHQHIMYLGESGDFFLLQSGISLNAFFSSTHILFLSSLSFSP